MKIKKLLSMALVGAMTVTMFAGCGSKDAGSDKAADGTIRLNVWRPTFNIGSGPDSDQLKKVEQKVNEYIKDKINVSVSITDISSNEYVEKANLALSNNEINLLWTASWESTIGTNDLVPKKAVYDITEILKGSKLYSSMDAGQWEATKYDGKSYFIPVYKDNVEGYDVMARKAHVDK